MYTFYSISLFFLRIAYGFLSIFDPKIRRAIEGRKKLFSDLEKYYKEINPLHKRILIHVSSFGELEQAKPVISGIKEKYPDIHIHLTFFSPSGFDNAIEKYSVPDFISYLPFDSQANVDHFLNITKPDLVLFVRYDVWHNLVHELHDRHIPMLLFSATFNSSIGKSFPFIHGLYRKTYSFINTICTVSESEKMAIEHLTIHAKNKILVCGDTRSDQVIARRNHIEETGEEIVPENILQKVSTENLKVFIVGSSWGSDEQFIFPVLEKAILSEEKILSIIAPHEIHRNDKAFEEYKSHTIKLSEITNYSGQRIIIVDSIGKLFALYRHATFAYIGGGFGAGVHNALEPSVWGVPSIVGPNHKRSKEIGALIGLGGAVEIQTPDQFEDAFHKWLANDMARALAAVAAKEYVYSSKGAAEKIMKEIEAYL